MKRFFVVSVLPDAVPAGEQGVSIEKKLQLSTIVIYYQQEYAKIGMDYL